MMNNNVNRKESRRLGALVNAQSKECWKNAWQAAALIPDAVYVEGWAIGIILTIHAWVEGPDGTIYDPSPWWCDNKGTRYFAGRRYTIAETLEALEHRRSLPIDDDFNMEMIPRDLVHVYREALTADIGEEGVAFLLDPTKVV